MFDEVLKLEIQTICLVHIIAIIISIVALMIFYIKAKNDFSLRAFLVLQSSMIGWMIFKIFKTVSPNEGSRWWFIVGYFFCICIVEISFLEFAYSSFKDKPLNIKKRIILYAIAMTQFIVILTNPYHYLFYSYYDIWRDSWGPLFFVHMGIEYGFILIGIYYCYKTFKIRLSNKKRKYKLLITLAITVPLIFNILFITTIFHDFLRSIGIKVMFDLTPIVFTWSLIVFVFATFNSDFIKLSPLLRHEMVHKLNTPICVLDSAFTPVYSNECFNEMFLDSEANIAKLITARSGIEPFIRKETEIEIDEYAIIIKAFRVNSYIETQYLMTFRNVTPYRNAEKQINERQNVIVEQNKELNDTINVLKETSKAGARRYIARELHDIIGHSLVVAIKLLEVAKAYYNRDKELCSESIRDALKSLETGLLSMKSVKEKSTIKASYNGGVLKKDIAKTLEGIHALGINTSIHVKGHFCSIDDKTYDVIKKVCTELITNAIKHGNPSEVLISIDITPEEIHILIIDNGIGCGKIDKGNGLNGIDKRLSLIGGVAAYTSNENEGFMCNITISNKNSG